ncbi:MFS transporter [Streptomyces tricolor]|nr:MFS transporter [Streptomyces tricolor]
MVAALVFGDLFPRADPAVGTVAAFGTFAAGYAARPLGGIVFGHFGDRIGRKSMMVLTMALMGCGSFLIGVLPTYATIGVWAPVLLVALRVVQGIAIGGEWGGATLMVVEHAERTQGAARPVVRLHPARRPRSARSCRPAWSRWSPRCPTTRSAPGAGGCRSLLSVVPLAVGLFVRLRVAEKPLSARTAREPGDTPPVVEVLRRPKIVLLAARSASAPSPRSRCPTGFMISYAVEQGYTRPQVLTAVTVASCVALLVLPTASAPSDRVGRRPRCWPAPSPRPPSPSRCSRWVDPAPPAR